VLRASPLAVFRAQKDLLDRGCDLICIEFAVHDYQVPTDLRSRTREGLIRKLLREEARDLVIVYTFSQPMYEDMIGGRIWVLSFFFIAKYAKCGKSDKGYATHNYH
jgi:hypothetical protein